METHIPIPGLCVQIKAFLRPLSVGTLVMYAPYTSGIKSKSFHDNNDFFWWVMRITDVGNEMYRLKSVDTDFSENHIPLHHWDEGRICRFCILHMAKKNGYWHKNERTCSWTARLSHIYPVISSERAREEFAPYCDAKCTC